MKIYGIKWTKPRPRPAGAPWLRHVSGGFRGAKITYHAIFFGDWRAVGWNVKH